MTLYAWLMVLSLAGPLALSFDKKVAFYKWWPALFTGITFNLILFVIWDSWFTRSGVWGFNPAYVLPVRWMSLPPEEWSFFVVVPYASIFIYACVKAYFSDNWWISKAAFFNWVFIAACVLGIVFFWDRTYTLVNLSLSLILLLLHQFWLKPNWIGYFWFAYLIHLIPFFIVNGVLTGGATPEPVVYYNAKDIIGLRLYTIPVEDTFYALTCLLLPITILELIRNRSSFFSQLASNP